MSETLYAVLPGGTELASELSHLYNPSTVWSTMMRGLACIDEYVSTYEYGSDRTPLRASEQALLKDALIGYVCQEQWMQGRPDVESAITAIDAAKESIPADLLPTIGAALDAARALIIDLKARLYRREDANMIMREHLAMTSHFARTKPNGQA